MLAAILSLTSPALVLPFGLTAHPMALSAASRYRVAPCWLQMQEDASEPEAAGATEPEVETAAATTTDAADDAPDEKTQLKDQITALEKELVDARGQLLAEQAAAKDAGSLCAVRRAGPGAPGRV